MPLFLLLNKSNPHDHMEHISFIESDLQKIMPNVGLSTRKGVLKQSWLLNSEGGMEPLQSE